MDTGLFWIPISIVFSLFTIVLFLNSIERELKKIRQIMEKKK